VTARALVTGSADPDTDLYVAAPGPPFIPAALGGTVASRRAATDAAGTYVVTGDQFDTPALVAVSHDDGTTWTVIDTTDGGEFIRGSLLLWDRDGARFLADCTEGGIAESPDGETWTHHANPSALTFELVHCTRHGFVQFSGGSTDYRVAVDPTAGFTDGASPGIGTGDPSLRWLATDGVARIIAFGNGQNDVTFTDDPLSGPVTPCGFTGTGGMRVAVFGGARWIGAGSYPDGGTLDDRFSWLESSDNGETWTCHQEPTFGTWEAVDGIFDGASWWFSAKDTNGGAGAAVFEYDGAAWTRHDVVGPVSGLRPITGFPQPFVDSALAGSALLELEAGGALTARAALSGTAFLKLTAGGALTAVGPLTGTAVLELEAGGTLGGAGMLEGTALLTVRAFAHFLERRPAAQETAVVDITAPGPLLLEPPVQETAAPPTPPWVPRPGPYRGGDA
jgi:hypothetical protein